MTVESARARPRSRHRRRRVPAHQPESPLRARQAPVRRLRARRPRHVQRSHRRRGARRADRRRRVARADREVAGRRGRRLEAARRQARRQRAHGLRARRDRPLAREGPRGPGAPRTSPPANPAGLGIPITLDLWDEDSFVYGDNDHGDINRYDRRKRLALVYLPDTVVPPTRASAGSQHGGRLGDGDQASLTYTIETLTPRPPPPPPPDAPPPAAAEPGRRRPRPRPKPDLVISALGFSER